MSYWKIQWEFAPGRPGKKKLYESEKSFEQYWKYHVEFEDYLATIRVSPCTLVAYKDGVEIRRYPAV